MNHNKKEKINIKNLYLLPTILLVVGVFSLLMFKILSNGHYINYQEDSNVNYSVCLKDNNFYESKCIERGNQYVASLIDYIPANFNYKLDLQSGIEYSYNYRIIAEFNVTDGDNDKVLFTKNEVLYTSEDKITKNGMNINIIIC